MRSVVLYVMLIVALATTQCNAAFWDVELVYAGWFTSGDASLAISPANVPTASYSANDVLYLATRGAEFWTSQPVANVGYLGGWSAHAYNSLGQPCIAYVDATGTVTDYVKYAHKPGAAWATEVIDSTGWMPDRLALAFAPSGQACVAYCKTTGTYPNLTHKIRFARRSGINNWLTQDVSQIGSVTAPALAIGPANTAYVAFCDSSTGQMKLATSAAGGPWGIETVEGDLSAAAIAYPAIALQPDDNPAVAYVVNSVGGAKLKLARKAGGSWAIEPAVALQASEAYHCALCIDASGMPFIAYRDPATSSFKNAWRHGGGWFTESVDEASGSGLCPSLRMDSLGNIDAAYYDDANSAVRFAWAVAPKDLATAKAGPGGSWIQISGLIVTNIQGEIGGCSTPRVYAQTPDRTCGIALYHGPSGVARGDIVDCYGLFYTDNGERVLYNNPVSVLGSTEEPKPLAMGNFALGGGDWHYTPGPVGTGQQGVLGGVGLNNTGLLVRTWGWFKYDNPGEFRVEDGSGALVNCRMPSDVTVSPNWQYVGVTGVSSCRIGAGGLERVLRVRSLSDIVVLF